MKTIKKNIVLITTAIILLILSFGIYTISNYNINANNTNKTIEKKQARQNENGTYFNVSINSGEIVLASNNSGGLITIEYNLTIEYLIPSNNTLKLYSDNVFATSKVREYKNGSILIERDGPSILKNFNANEIMISAIKINSTIDFTYIDFDTAVYIETTFIFYGQNEPAQTLSQRKLTIATSGWATYYEYNNNYWNELGEFITANYLNGLFVGESIINERVYQEGYDNGYELGYSQGYSSGESTCTESFTNDWISSLFDGITNIFNIEVFPHFKLWYCIGAPLLVALIVAILKLLR